jgi:BirA family transcriptional regulator, biotin operon repressor / biotin---[acetyl-CoA-carboxylase] ligase
MPAIAPIHDESPPCLSEGWVIHALRETRSTNNAASRLPSWHAVRAQVQTEGRGRTGRHWVSDEGGLWLSAVVPCPGARAKWSILPLAAGWAFIAALQDFGAPDLRLRWPNDIMTGPRKLAGLLVERYTDDTAVVGVGVNVFNAPDAAEPALAGQTARLADLVPGGYTLEDVMRLLLRSLGRAHTLIRQDGFGAIADELNRRWGKPRLVAVTLSGRAATFTGLFHGIDQGGRLLLATERDGLRAYDPTQVALLRELE